MMVPSAMASQTIIETARGWIGTPYHHQASVRGVGSDCLGLVRGVWRDVYGTDAELPPAYSPDWAEASGRETLLAAARRHLVEVERDQRRPGDVLLFRFRSDLPAKHAAIQVSDGTMVHAAAGAPAAEVPLSPWWLRRLAGAFRFPNISD